MQLNRSNVRMCEGAFEMPGGIHLGSTVKGKRMAGWGGSIRFLCILYVVVYDYHTLDWSRFTRLSLAMAWFYFCFFAQFVAVFCLRQKKMQKRRPRGRRRPHGRRRPQRGRRPQSGRRPRPRRLPRKCWGTSMDFLLTASQHSSIIFGGLSDRICSLSVSTWNILGPSGTLYWRCTSRSIRFTFG